MGAAAAGGAACSTAASTLAPRSRIFAAALIAANGLFAMSVLPTGVRLPAPISGDARRNCTRFCVLRVVLKRLRLARVERAGRADAHAGLLDVLHCPLPFCAICCRMRKRSAAVSGAPFAAAAFASAASTACTEGACGAACATRTSFPRTMLSTVRSILP